MATNFQSAVTFVLMKFFSKSLLHFACVVNREKLWKKFFHFGSRWQVFEKIKAGGLFLIFLFQQRVDNTKLMQKTD
jgi:hypothetical protein